MPALHACLDELAQRDELARVLVAELARQTEQAWIARGLTEAREPGEDLDVAPREALALDLAHDLRAHLLEDGARRAPACSPASSQKLSVSIFSGRSLATSDFVRRRMNGWIVARSAWAAFLSRASIGRE